MKRIVCLLLVLSVLLSNQYSITTLAKNDLNNEKEVNILKEKWDEKELKYPMNLKSDKWDSFDFTEVLEICNPDKSVLADKETADLMNLMLNYPFLVDLLVFESPDAAIQYYDNTSTVFKEICNRPDYVETLINAYKEIKIDYKLMKEVSDYDFANLTSEQEKELGFILIDSNYIQELFLQMLLASEIMTMDKKEYKNIGTLIEQRYKDKKLAELDKVLTTKTFFYDQLLHYTKEIPSELLPKEIIKDIEKSDSNLSGWSEYGWSAGFNNATYLVGTYSKYGVSSLAYSLVSGELQGFEQESIVRSIQYAHPNWVIVAGPTKKYNCHAYAWVSTSASTNYWINDPSAYANTFRIRSTYGKAYSGDNIIIYQGMSAVHSLDTASSGTSSSQIMTRSKLGQNGVFIAPLNEMMTLYSGITYTVYY